MNDISDMIEKLEAATYGSRELSDTLALAIGWKQTTHGDNTRGYFVPRYLTWTSPDGTQQPPGDWWPPSFTQSLDAALTLVPQNCMKYGIEVYASTGRYKNGCDFPAGQHSNWVQVREAATPALAVCIASLKERAKSQKDKQDDH